MTYRDTVTGYHSEKSGHITLTRWDGATMLDTRAEVIHRYRTNEGDGYAVMFSLPKNRFIVGYSLGDGMLFRGCLIQTDSKYEASQTAKNEASFWIDRDDEDSQQFDYEQSLED
jgi:hypothetical protein